MELLFIAYFVELKSAMQRKKLLELNMSTMAIKIYNDTMIQHALKYAAYYVFVFK